MAKAKAKETAERSITLQAPHQSAGSVGTADNEHALDENGIVTLNLDNEADAALAVELTQSHGYKEI